MAASLNEVLVSDAGVQAVRRFQLAWRDEFAALSLRSGGPTFDGLSKGKGTYSAPGAWYSANPKGMPGYGYDFFVDPACKELGYNPFAITPEGLRIRAMPAPASIAALLPTVRDRVPWMSGQLVTRHSVRFRPPFYVEGLMKMPAAASQPFPAFWLTTTARRPWPNDKGKDYEIDIHEGFGDDDRLHATLHWNTAPDTADYPSKTIVDKPVPRLSTGFNLWGCECTSAGVRIFFNRALVGATEHPAGAAWDQEWQILLNLSSGVPWDNKPPIGAGAELLVRYLRLYLQDPAALVLA